MNDEPRTKNQHPRTKTQHPTTIHPPNLLTLTNRELLNKGIKYLSFSLPLTFIGPSVIYNAFMNQHTPWHYLVLGIGIAMCIGAVYLMFRGILTIVKGLFNE